MKLRGSPSPLRAEANYWTSRHLCALGNFSQSVECADEALSMGDRVLPVELRCSLLALLAFSLSELGESERALQHANHAVKLARANGLPEHESIACIRVGLCLSRMGETEQAELQLLRALSLARETHGAAEIFDALNQLIGATIARCEQLKNTDQAILMDLTITRARLYAQQAAAMAARGRDPVRLLTALNNQGKVLALAGDWDLAEANFRRVCAEASDLDLLMLSMRARFNLGALLNCRGRFDEARAELLVLVARLDIVDHIPLRKTCLVELERSCLALGLLQCAIECVHSRERLNDTTHPTLASEFQPSTSFSMGTDELEQRRIADLASTTIERISRLSFSGI